MTDDGIPDLPKARQAAGAKAARKQFMMEGVPVSLLADMFHTSRQNVRRKLADVKPIAYRDGNPLYDIAHAAERLVKPKVDLAAYIKTLRPADVPVALQKQFWDAQNGRLKYMTDAEDLWHSVKVQMAIGDLFKLIRQRVQLLADTVERQTGLTDEQRRIIEGISDAMLEDLHDSIIENFKEYKVEGERDDVFEKGPPDSSLADDDDDDDEDDEPNAEGIDPSDPFEGL